jgi:hypothetical protein
LREASIAHRRGGRGPQPTAALGAKHETLRTDNATLSLNDERRLLSDSGAKEKEELQKVCAALHRERR